MNRPHGSGAGALVAGATLALATSIATTATFDPGRALSFDDGWRAFMALTGWSWALAHALLAAGAAYAAREHRGATRVAFAAAALVLGLGVAHHLVAITSDWTGANALPSFVLGTLGRLRLIAMAWGVAALLVGLTLLQPRPARALVLAGFTLLALAVASSHSGWQRLGWTAHRVVGASMWPGVMLGAAWSIRAPRPLYAGLAALRDSAVGRAGVAMAAAVLLLVHRGDWPVLREVQGTLPWVGVLLGLGLVWGAMGVGRADPAARRWAWGGAAVLAVAVGLLGWAQALHTSEWIEGGMRGWIQDRIGVLTAWGWVGSTAGMGLIAEALRRVADARALSGPVVHARWTARLLAAATVVLLPIALFANQRVPGWAEVPMVVATGAGALIGVYVFAAWLYVTTALRRDLSNPRAE